MIGFFRDISVNPLLLNGLLAGLLASVTCGVVGPYVIARRIVFLSGAIAHIAVGGIGAAIFVRYHFPSQFGWLSPMLGAIIVALIGAVVISIVHQRVRERMDTLIGAMWAVGMSVGIVLIKFTPGYHTELMSYLFGNISVVSRVDVMTMGILAVVVLIIAGAFHKRLFAICLDEQQAALQGVPVLAMNTLLLAMVALTVICLMQVVGLILVLALLTLPAASASRFAIRFGPVVLMSIIFAALATTLPRMAVYGTRISPESAIVLAAGALYLAAVLIKRQRAGT